MLSIRVPLMCVFFFFLPVPLPLRQRILFITFTFLIYVNKFTLTKFLWLCTQSPSNILLGTYFLWNCIYIPFKFHFHCFHFSFLRCTFCLLGQFPLLIFHFCKMSHGSVTRKQEGNTTTWFAVCAWTEHVNSDQSLIDFEGDIMNHWSWDASVHRCVTHS